MVAQPTSDTISAAILILGSRGAERFAAPHTHGDSAGGLRPITLKGLLGKLSCTRTARGLYNAMLPPANSPGRHFRDTVEGGI
jgi:fumarate reductase flavoprotein subunit